MNVLRLREIELEIAVEFVATLYVVLLFACMAIGVRTPLARAILPIVAAAIAFLTYRSWKTRVRHRQHLLNWDREPLHWTGSVVIQQNDKGETTGTIDPRGHYTVRWQKFSADRALYFVTQNDQTIRISTLAPNAPEILKDALRVANYPCEDWPNLDL